MKILLSLSLIISSLLVFAEFIEPLEDRSPVIDLNLTITDASAVAEIDRVLDGYAGKYAEMMANVDKKYNLKGGKAQ